MSLARVRIPSKWNGGAAVADFKLGLGPCGKVVTKLAVEYTSYGVIIKQTCEDGEYKRFIYLTKGITGRIEETWA